MELLTPAYLSFALTAPLIVLLYFLKLRRREVTVSSTFLWQRAQDEYQANAPWRRLKTSLLLYLQVAVALLLALALAGPYWRATAALEHSLVLVLDCSLSMRTQEGNQTRFDQAIDLARRAVQAMGRRDEATIIAMGEEPVVLVAHERDQGRLLAALDNLQPGRGRANLDEALKLARVVSEGRPHPALYLISDGRLPAPDPDILYPGEIRFLPVGQARDNLAVADLSVRSVGGNLAVLARIVNFGAAQRRVEAELHTDGILHSVKAVDIPAGQAYAAIWPSVPEAMAFSVRLRTSDALREDDQAWAVIASGETRRVLLVTRGNAFLERLLALLPGLDVYRVQPDSYTGAAGYDLAIYDRFLPEGDPGVNLLAFRPPAGWLVLPGTARPGHGPVRAGHERMDLTAYVDLSDVHVGETVDLSNAGWGKAFLVDDGGSVAVAGEAGLQRRVVFGFDLHHSDLPLRTAFPLLMYNVIDWLLPPPVGASGPVLPGAAVPLSVSPSAQRLTIVSPSGRRFTYETPLPRVFAQTDELGVYSVVQEAGGQQSRGWLVVNPPVAESDLTPVSSLSMGRTEIGAAGAQRGNQDLWPLLAALALLILAGEWWVYCRGS